LLSEIIRQYSEKIRDDIFKKDFAGVIATIRFGDETGVYSDTYIDQMRNGKWLTWRTPKKHRELDGKHRKLLLYDPVKKAITVEVEISNVEQANEEEGYPWNNDFAEGTLRVYQNPIAVEHIRTIESLKKLGRGQNAIINLTHEQYRQIRKLSDTVI
jgi:hypothetical protein